MGAMEGEGGDDELDPRPLSPYHRALGPKNPRGSPAGGRRVLHPDPVPLGRSGPRTPREVPETGPPSGVDCDHEPGPREIDRTARTAGRGSHRHPPEGEGSGA